MRFNYTRALAASLATVALAGAALPAGAQDSTEARLRKAESEIRALQRKVFPGGDGKFFEPEITAAQPSGTTPVRPSTTAVTDILARLDALESQLARLTSQTEENSNAIQQLTTRLGALEVVSTAAASATAEAKSAAPDSNLSAMTGGARPAVSVPGPSVSAATTAAATTPPAATVAKPTPPPSPAAARPAGPSAQRLAAVQAIAKPQTDDPGADEYTYGYRLWQAKFYPEAQQQLSLFIEKHPRHKQISYGRNLLGRAYFDAGNYDEAAKAFFGNYDADPQGERAPDSLLYLAETMIALKDTKGRACKALVQLSESHPAALARLRVQYEATRLKAKCPAGK